MESLDMDGAAKKYIVPAFIVLALSSAAYLAWVDDQNNQTLDAENVPFGVEKGYRLRDVEVTGLDGKPIPFSDYRGSILVVDFMAPWCSPCKEQIKVLIQLSQSTDAEILSINVDPGYNSTYLARFRDDEKMTWTLASSAEAAMEYKVTAIPLILVADRDGVIRYRGYYTTLTKFQQIIDEIG
jgi:thiol-disulfide isomerase/thioredoxin